MSKRIVIIGGGDAGTYTLEAIMKRKGDVAITLLKKDRYGSVSICGLPFALQGIYPLKDIELQGPEFFQSRGIDYRTLTEVTEINLESNSVTIQTGEELEYDYLVIATGSRPFIPSIPGVELEGVYTVKDMEDGERIEVAMNDPGVKNAVVIGAGTIALQVAVAFSKNNIKTTVTKPRPLILRSMLDPDIASKVQKKLEELEIRFILGKETVAIKGDGDVKSVLIGDTEVPADIVVVCAGMRPNVDLAKEAGIEIGESGGIATDPFLHVKKGRGYIDNVYAAGDCVEVIDAITHRPRLSMLASTCVTQAKVIADNIFGDNSSFDPVLSPTVANIAGLQVGSVGITSETAKRYGMKVITGKKEKPTKPRYYPGRKSMLMKLLFDAYSERLIGAQIISEDQVADRIDELSIAIRSGMRARELRLMEKSFDPSVALHRDVMADAAEDALNV
ncbi:MAG: FAD-dependent oxidoreductase [Candidatus Syntropharchaeales archaeon]